MAEQMKQEAAGKTIPAGYKQTEVGVIPEDWGCLDLSEFFSFKQGIQVPVEKQSKTRLDGFVRFIRIIDLTNQNEPPRYIKNIRKTECLTSNDLFMVRYGAPGLVGFNKEGLIANNLFRLLPKVDLHEGFYFYYLGFRHADILDVSGSSTMPAINFSTISKFKIVKPSSVKEQTAIASVLSDSDALIDALEQLIAKKQAIKSATMQQLLTGRTRLPAFALRPDGTKKGYKPSELGEIPEDWELLRLGSCCHITTGKKDVNEGSQNGEYPFFTCSRNYTYSSSFSFDLEAILIAGNGEVGNLHYYNGKFEAYQRTYVLHGFIFGVWFVWYQLEFKLSESLGLGKIGSTIPYIKKGNLTEFKFFCPSLDAEQTAIATILSDMDNELQALTQKLEKARALKQGMMQQLLTGKIRLPLAAGA